MDFSAMTAAGRTAPAMMATGGFGKGAAAHSLICWLVIADAADGTESTPA
jgi:hypothetical protein